MNPVTPTQDAWTAGLPRRDACRAPASERRSPWLHRGGPTTARCLAGVVAVMLAVAGCDTPTPDRTSGSSTPATSAGAPSATTGSLRDGLQRSVDSRGRRTDPGPLTSRFAALGTPEAVTWVGGTVGDGRAVGPTTIFIDAVVRLTPQAAADLRVRAGALAPREVDVVAPLRSALPAGPLAGSRALDLALSSTRYSASGALAADGRTLVLRALGQG